MVGRFDMKLSAFLAEVTCMLVGEDVTEDEFRHMTRFACQKHLDAIMVPASVLEVCRGEITEWRKKEPFMPHQLKVVEFAGMQNIKPHSNLLNWKALQHILAHWEED